MLRGGSRGKAGQEVLGYLRGGFGLMVEALEQRLRDLGVEIAKGAPVTEIRPGANGGLLARTPESDEGYDEVVVTTAPALLADMAPSLPDAYRERLRSIEYMANVCCVLRLSQSLSSVYWLNISDNTVPFVGLVEHTNMQPPSEYGGSHLVYLTRYCSPDDAYYNMRRGAGGGLRASHQAPLPHFQPDWIEDSYVWRERYAQPVIARHYSQLRPDYPTPIAGLWLASMAQIYPEDRGMNYAVQYGHSIAERMLASRGG